VPDGARSEEKDVVTRPTRKVSALVAAGALALGLSGCSTHPGDAATVGSHSIGTAHLDEVATAICSAQAGSQQAGQPQQQSSRSNRELALGLLIDSQLSAAYGAAEGLHPPRQQLDRAMASRAQLLASVPAKDRDVLRSTLTDLDASQLTMAEAGRRALQQAGSKNITAQTAIPAGLKVRNDWVSKHLDVSVDPRFGTFSHGNLQARSGSLSTAVSSQARAGAKTQPSASWLASLPATQKCS
jgi:hypothetical protein